MSALEFAWLRYTPPFRRPEFGLAPVAAGLSAAALLAFAGHLADAERKTPIAVEQAPVAAAKPALPAAPAPAAIPARLDPAMRNALDYTARRYRLSPHALEPIFSAAVLAANEAGIDPLLVIAVIGIESGFNPLSGSVMGAQGLMQIIPRYHADKLPPDRRVGDAARQALFDPVVNVRVGTRVLQEYIRAGEGVVEGLQTYVGAVDDPDQGYAAKVLAELDRLEVAARAAPRR